MKRLAVALVCVSSLVLGVAAPALATEPPGYSDPVRTDSMYPAESSKAIDVEHYGLSLRWDSTRHVLAGRATLTIRPTVDATSFSLALASTMHVSAATLDAAAVTTTHTGHTLVVDHAVTTDQVVTLVLRYSGRPKPVAAPTSRSDMTTVGWHTARHGAAWTMQEPYGAFTWYPVNDQPSDKATYSVRLNVPSKFIGVSNGTMTSRRTVGKRLVTTFSNDQPMASYLVTVAIGHFHRYTQTGPHGIPMTYWYPANNPGLVAPLKSTPGELAWLEHRLGYYPFSTVGIVIVPAATAVETQTMITLGSGLYRYGAQSIREAVVHELVHSWYGDSVTPGDWSDLWMNEGFAMYLEAQYTIAQHWKTSSYWTHTFARNDDYWRWLYGPPGAYKHGQFGQTNVYYCSALMLEKLRAKLGAGTFAALLHDWPHQAPYTSQVRADYIAFVKQETGEDLTSWFDSWLDDATTPSS